jgi:AcrR family transcriptional regulator
MPAPKTRARYVPGPRRGDQRREALLGALDKLLTTRPLADIGIAEISREAGVTRSAFYFYFPTKAAAVAALMANFEMAMTDAATDWYEGGTGTPLERLQAGFDASIGLWRERAGLLVAMLDAAGTDAEAREIWESWIEGFRDRITSRIEADRDAGLTKDITDARAIATVLMGAALHGMERDVRAIVAGHGPSDTLPSALVETWHRTLYRGP